MRVIGEEAPETIIPSGEDVTVNEVNGEPEVGGVNDTTAWPLPDTAETERGADGAPGTLPAPKDVPYQMVPPSNVVSS